MKYTNLYNEIFTRHNTSQADSLLVISGYLGPSPVNDLLGLSIPSKVIYGMYGSDGIKQQLHNALVQTQQTPNNNKVDIMYSSTGIHSKCYVWYQNGQIIDALIGSANFSVNGLTTPFREVLTDVSHSSFSDLDGYINLLRPSWIPCSQGQPSVLTRTSRANNIATPDPNACFLSLTDRTGQVQAAHGLNWGQNPNNHTRRDDANIPVRVDHIRHFPNLFPPKQLASHHTGGRSHRHNDSIEIIWDDGVQMTAVLEGTQSIANFNPNNIYPKQICSFPSKDELGRYLRTRLGVAFGQPVGRNDLDQYGRLDIGVSLIAPGIYSFDFSV
ncbi:MAG: NgoFVII family restriction endonuclease [Pseudomonadota bacterium]|nr:NgoFVII family restriction endonuclease [Pseudomonadota bacterium]